MKGYIGYIRVSTVKQGTQGVSLHEQREAIARFAEHNCFPITVWLEEIETAAKQGRPIFTKALHLLHTGKAQGIILHKLDRGARNLRDWAAIGELSDQGIEVHFVNEGLDLQSRGGRLSADIQAVVAADYIRNLREETRKGFYGRLKQGLYPLRAPIGYDDQGKGKAKTINPMMGPLTRKAFELYASGKYSLKTLGDEMFRFGLRNRHGGRVTINGLSTILKNPFYIGIIRIEKSKETFAGIHEPLISKILFDRVQAMLNGKAHAKIQRHDYAYRRLITCSVCQYSLVAEKQKGRVYYRCHTQHAPRTSLREDVIEAELLRFFERIQFSEKEKAYFRSQIPKMRKNWADQREELAKGMKLKLAQIKDRFNRLTDAYLDQALDKTTFEERKSNLLLEQKAVEESLKKTSSGDVSLDGLEEFLELAGNAGLSYQTAIPELKRALVEQFTSNRTATAKKIKLEPSEVFQLIANRPNFAHCDLKRDIPRIWINILTDLARLNTQGLLPDLSLIRDFGHEEDKV